MIKLHLNAGINDLKTMDDIWIGMIPFVDVVTVVLVVNSYGFGLFIFVGTSTSH